MYNVYIYNVYNILKENTYVPSGPYYHNVITCHSQFTILYPLENCSNAVKDRLLDVATASVVIRRDNMDAMIDD